MLENDSFQALSDVNLIEMCFNVLLFKTINCIRYICLDLLH